MIEDSFNATPSVGRIEVPNAILLGQVKEELLKGNKVTINVKGYSMRPFLEHLRDKVELSPVKELQVGQAVLAEIAPGKYVLHRIIALRKSEAGDTLQVELMGDGNVRGTEHCAARHVVGLVTQYLRNGKTIPASNVHLKRAVCMWRRLLPVRRYLLFLYRLNLKLHQ